MSQVMLSPLLPLLLLLLLLCFPLHLLLPPFIPHPLLRTSLFCLSRSSLLYSSLHSHLFPHFSSSSTYLSSSPSCSSLSSSFSFFLFSPPALPPHPRSPPAHCLHIVTCHLLLIFHGAAAQKLLVFPAGSGQVRVSYLASKLKCQQHQKTGL